MYMYKEYTYIYVYKLIYVYHVYEKKRREITTIQCMSIFDDILRLMKIKKRKIYI